MTTYTITCDNGDGEEKVIHDSRLVDDVFVLEPELEFSMGGTGQLTFKLPPGNLAYDLVQKLKSEVTVWVDDTWAFSGRVLNDPIDFDAVRTVEVEGELGYLNDSIVRPYEYEGDLRPLLDKLLTDHGRQVGDGRRFTLGDVTVANASIERTSGAYPNTWAELDTAFLKEFGGYFRTRRDANGVRILDYIVDYDRVNTQVVNFGENLVNLDKTIHGEDIATAIIPLGIKFPDSDERLTIADVNGGADFVADLDAVEKYGWVFHTVIFDDVDTPEALLTAGRAALSQQKLLGITLDVEAVDLSLIDVDIERIRVGDKLRVISPPHDVDEYLQVQKLRLNLAEASQSSIVLGAQHKELTDALNSGLASKLATELEPFAKTSAVNQKLDRALGEASTTFTPKAALTETVQVTQAQIAQTDTAAARRFDDATGRTAALESSLAGQRAEREGFLRYGGDTVELGKADGPLAARVTGAEVALLQNGQRVVSVSENKANMTAAEVRDRLALGSPGAGYFDFVPQSSGNLSLKWRA